MEKLESDFLPIQIANESVSRPIGPQGPLWNPADPTQSATSSWFKILYSLHQESLTIHTFHYSNVFVFRIYLLPCYSIVLPPSSMLCQAFSNQLK